MRDADGHLRPYHVTQQAGQPDTHWMHWGGVEWLQMHRNDQGAYSHNGFAQTNVRPVNKLDLRRLALCNLARVPRFWLSVLAPLTLVTARPVPWYLAHRSSSTVS